MGIKQVKTSTDKIIEKQTHFGEKANSLSRK